MSRSPRKLFCQLDERDLILSQLRYNREKSERARIGQEPYKSLWLDSELVERQMAASLRFLVSGDGDVWEREARVMQSAANDRLTYFCALQDGQKEIAAYEAAFGRGRERALKYFRQRILGKINLKRKPNQMIAEKFMTLLKEAELGDDCHIVVTDVKTGEKVEILSTYYDDNGVMNILTEGQSAGKMSNKTIVEIRESYSIST